MTSDLGFSLNEPHWPAWRTRLTLLSVITGQSLAGQGPSAGSLGGGEVQGEGVGEEGVHEGMNSFMVCVFDVPWGREGGRQAGPVLLGDGEVMYDGMGMGRLCGVV